MQETTDGLNVGGDSERTFSESPLVLPFRIINLLKVGPFGLKFGVGSVEIEGLGRLHFEVFVRDGEIRVVPESVRSRYTGAFCRTFSLEPDFRAALTEAVRARLEGDSVESA